MATRPALGFSTCAFGDLSPADRALLLAAERATWRERMSWDLGEGVAAQAEVAIRYGALGGSALRVGGRPAGYLSCQPCTTVVRLCAVHLPPASSAAPIELLVDAVVRELPADRRVEGQLVALEAQPMLDAAFASRGFEVSPRAYLGRPLTGVPPALRAVGDIRLSELRRGDVADCAPVLVAAHAGGVEARINAAFRDHASALGYLRDVETGPGCGTLLRAASSVATLGSRVVGFCLATRIAPTVAHVPQVAVIPELQGSAIGAGLLDRMLAAASRLGCTRVTLSVSAENRRAAAWYERRGFEQVTRFSSYHRDPEAARR